MMSCTASAALSRPILSLCCTEHGPYRGVVLSGRITSIAMYRSDQLSRRCIIEPQRPACLAGASVTHECALETLEFSCVPRAARPFFLPVVHSPPGVVGHMAAPELLSQEGRALSRRTRGSTGAPLSERQSPSRGTRDSTGAPLSGRQSPEP
jgi:hypothetical protein